MPICFFFFLICAKGIEPLKFWSVLIKKKKRKNGIVIFPLKSSSFRFCSRTFFWKRSRSLIISIHLLLINQAILKHVYVLAKIGKPQKIFWYFRWLKAVFKKQPITIFRSIVRLNWYPWSPVRKTTSYLWLLQILRKRDKGLESKIHSRITNLLHWSLLYSKVNVVDFSSNLLHLEIYT